MQHYSLGYFRRARRITAGALQHNDIKMKGAAICHIEQSCQQCKTVLFISSDSFRAFCNFELEVRSNMLYDQGANTLFRNFRHQQKQVDNSIL